MILQALARYYEILAGDPDSGIVRPGYSPAKVSLVVELSPQGELLGLTSCKIMQQRGKKMKEVPQTMSVPEQAKKTMNVEPNFLCENASYVFGIGDDKKDPQRVKKCFEAMCERHRDILSQVEEPQAKAVLAFFDDWDPDKAREHPALQSCLEELLGGALMVFRLDGAGRYAHEVPELQAAWERYREREGDTPIGQCLVCGERRPIARLHPSIKGVRGAQPTGASIVSFNATAFESYGYEKGRGKDMGQGLNAPVSTYAAFAYTAALNHLIANPESRMLLGDATVVYWAETSRPVYRQLFAAALNPSLPGAKDAGDGRARDAGAEKMAQLLMERISEGRPVPESVEVDPNTRFYVLALSPNASRLSVRFFLCDSFGHFLANINRHYRDLCLRHAPYEADYVPIWRLLAETVPPASKDKASSPLLSGAVLRAVLSGSAYPMALYEAILLRLRAERDVSYYKVSILKACLLRMAGLKPLEKEALTVAVNEDNHHPSYLLGRLFAVLESIQLDANPGINATIRDRYFNSACATPQAVFPTLMKLKTHHIHKLDTGLGIYYEKLIGGLESSLPDEGPYPSRLNLREQGIFIKGYYDQVEQKYAGKKKGEAEQ